MAGFTILETTTSVVTKWIVVSVGVISTVVLFKVAIISKLATLPRLWLSFKLLWASPLYVFIVFNFILFAVAASSAFRRQKDTIFHHFSPSSSSCFYYNSSEMIYNNQLEHVVVVEEELQKSDLPKMLCAYSNEKEDEDAGGDSMDATWKAILDSQEKQMPPQLMKKSQTWDSSPPPLPEDADCGDSMDATWKAIVESQENQTAPQLMKKSQTWDSPPLPRITRADHTDNDYEEPVKKSDRFHQTLSLRRKISMTSEELRGRAEAFIEMVNRSIRLQRQQSEQRFFFSQSNKFNHPS